MLKKKILKKQRRHTPLYSVDYSDYSFTTKEYIKYFLQGLALDVTISFLVYQSVISFIIFLPAIVIYFKYIKARLIKLQKDKLKSQFKEAIIILYGLISAGNSLESAFRRTEEDLLMIYKKDDLIVREFYYISRKLDMNVTLEKCLEDFALRSSDEDIRNFSEIISIAKRSGGSLLNIVKMTVNSISLKLEVEQEINTVVASKRNEFKIMCMIPIGIILYLKIFLPGFLNPLYGGAAGRIVMSVCFFGYTLVVLWGFKILDIEI